MLLHNVHVRGASSGETAVFRLPPACVILPTALFCLLFIPMPSASLWATSEPVAVDGDRQNGRPLDVDPGITYHGGTRLRIPGTPWSFVVPDRWKSNRPGDAEMPFLIPEEGKELGMIFPLTDVTRESIREQLSEPLSLLHGLSFIPAGSESETETSIARSYEGEDMAGRALAFLGPGNTAVIYFLMGPVEEASSFQAVLERLGDSTRFVDSVAGPQSGL